MAARERYSLQWKKHHDIGLIFASTFVQARRHSLEYRMRVGEDILIPGSPVVYPELGMDFNPHSPISLVPICSAETTQLYALALYIRYIDGCSEQGSNYSRSIFGKNNLSTLSHMN